jgi:carbamate kinase
LRPPVDEGWGTPAQLAIRGSPEALSAMTFAAGSMGPKVEAACSFVRKTGKRAVIGELAALSRIIAGEAGTTIDAAASGIVYAP